MPSLEASEPWVFRRNLLLSVCPVELLPTHQLLLSAEGNTRMLCGPFGSTDTAVCVLGWNSLRSTERASCGLGLLAMCEQQRCWEEPRRLQALLWCGQQGPGPAAASPRQAQTLRDSAPAVPARGSVWLLMEHKAWRKRNTRWGTGRGFQPKLVCDSGIPCTVQVTWQSVLLPWIIAYTRIGHSET